ncbi:MAG TPA: hypothetical protein VG142_07815 [Trebonia sp.]|nr:hypothetical protein [Trebonia sp.]
MMYPLSVHVFQADALFVSALQSSQQPSLSQIRQAIAGALDAYGDAGCAGRVAQEFGDHPESASARMLWARTAAAAASDQFASRMRRMAAADNSAFGRNPATGLSAIRSA